MDDGRWTISKQQLVFIRSALKVMAVNMLELEHVHRVETSSFDYQEATQMAHSKCEATCPKLCFLPVVDSCQRRTSQTMYTVGLDQACVLFVLFCYMLFRL